jgi:hypothetical protein
LAVAKEHGCDKLSPQHCFAGYSKLRIQSKCSARFCLNARRF